MTMQLTDVYRSMFGAAGMEVTTDGYARMAIGVDEKGKMEYLPVVAAEGRSVVIPLPEILRSPNVRELEVFHLLNENSAVTNQSDLLTRYRHWLISRFNIVIGGMGSALLRIAADEAMSKKLRPDQQDYLALVVGADDNACENFGKIAEAASRPNQLQKVFMSMYIRNAAVLEGKSYGRVTAVNFPFFDELTKLEQEKKDAKAAPKGQKKKIDNVVFDIAIREKDRAIFMGIMHYLIPNLNLAKVYDVGSNSHVAPSIDSMMRAFYPMAKHLNEINQIFRKIDPAIDLALEEMLFDLDWIDAFQDLDALWPQIRMTPNQNQGVIEEPKETATPKQMVQQANQGFTPPWPTGAPAASYPAPAPTHNAGYPAPTQPVPARATPAPSSGSGVSVADMMRNSTASRHQLGHPPMPGYGYPQPGQMMTQYPGMGMQYPQAGGYPAPNQGYPAPGGMPNYSGGRRSY